MMSGFFLDKTDVKVRSVIDAGDVRLGRYPAVYVIENTENGKLYVGSTKDITRRLNCHRTCLIAGTHSNRNLQHEFDSCIDKAAIKIHVAKEDTVQAARAREQSILDEGFDSGELLNVSNNAYCSSRGYDRTAATEKMLVTKNTIEHRSLVSENTKRMWENPDIKRKIIKEIGRNITIDGIEYGSIREASRVLNVATSTIASRVVEGESTVDLSDVKPSSKRVSIGGKTYETITKAAEELGVAGNTLTWRLKSSSDKWKDHYYL